MSIANCSDFSLNVIEPEIVDLVGALKKPSGAIEPCLLKKLGDGGHLGEYTNMCEGGRVNYENARRRTGELRKCTKADM